VEVGYMNGYRRGKREVLSYKDDIMDCILEGEECTHDGDEGAERQ